MTTATVLYIEDNPDNAELIVRRLTKEGIKAQIAQDGVTGITQAMLETPNLILLDFNLPDIDGREVMRRLRGHRQTANIPVVMLTADSSASMRKTAYEIGCQGYLTKPVKKPDLLAALNRFL